MPRLRERLRPGDLVLLALLVLACALALARLPGHPEVWAPLLRHAALLAGFAALLGLAVAGRLPWSGPVRIVASVALVFQLYVSLGRLGFLLHDRAADAALAAIDARLLGVDPSLWLDGRVGRGLVEAMSAVYLFYLGWVYLSLVLECLGREEEDREAFLLGLTLTYAVAYLGYLLLPAHGPAGFHAARYAHPLPGGPIYEAMHATVEANGGAIGAFPSLHVGGAFFLCAFSLRRNRMRGLTYLPVVPLVALSTVVLRWHWVIDWFAGIAVALLALAVTPRILPAGPMKPAPPVPPRERGSRFYRFFRAYVRLVLRIFFRSRDVSGLEHVPRAGPVLLVSNHVNGLVDPLVVMVALERRLTLTAKNTLGRNPFLAVLIRALGAVLFHRSQDRGKGAELRENARALARCQELLAAGGAVLIFPEGESHSDPGMRPFKPGAARIAADFVRRHPGVRLAVVPVGLYYTRKDRFRSGVALRFGPPLPLGDLLAEAERGAAAVQALNAAEAEAIRALTLDLESERQSEVLSWAAVVLLAWIHGPRLPGELTATAADELEVKRALHDGHVQLQARDPARLAALEARVGDYHARLRALRLAPAELRVRHTAARSVLFAVRELEIAAVGLPWALAGLAASAAPYLLVDLVARLTSRDLDHWATQKIYPSLLIYPLCYLAEAALASALLGPWAGLAVLVLAPPAGYYAQLWRERMRDAARRVRTFLTLAARPALARALVAEGDAIHAELVRVRDELALRAGA
jgi:glycerol-3-phosphate O-acyltransferase / dihydroxyacetone phosphate acyltransferase